MMGSLGERNRMHAGSIWNAYKLVRCDELEVRASSNRLRFKFPARAERNQRSSKLSSNNLVPGPARMQAIRQQRFKVFPADEFIVQFDQWQVVLFRDATSRFGVGVHRLPGRLSVFANIQTRRRSAKYRSNVDRQGLLSQLLQVRCVPIWRIAKPAPRWSSVV